jgi:hypothetical protein
VRNVILAGFIIFPSPGKIEAEPKIFSDNLQFNKVLLENQCGYVLERNLSDQVYKSSSTINEKTVYVDFYLHLAPAQRTIQGKLSFACLKAEFSDLAQGAFQKTTAAEEIALEDSGGRYVRNIVWQRKHEGRGWTGTIAYINSISGDQTNLPVPDYFFVCPDKSGITCFSLEIERTRLRTKESDRISKFLHEISLTDPRKSLPDTSGPLLISDRNLT